MGGRKQSIQRQTILTDKQKKAKEFNNNTKKPPAMPRFGIREKDSIGVDSDDSDEEDDFDVMSAK